MKHKDYYNDEYISDFSKNCMQYCQALTKKISVIPWPAYWTARNYLQGWTVLQTPCRKTCLAVTRNISRHFFTCSAQNQHSLRECSGLDGGFGRLADM